MPFWKPRATGMAMYDWLHHICVVLAYPLKVKAIADAKIKTDTIDATVLAHLLRADLVHPSPQFPDVNSARSLIF
ncbi:hypothetical protein BAE40_13235 [Mesorhizobium loti]|uniref:hypothetical protein n=1 Tax=Mesorhizobium ciceri TaxID=39645 RepID=UPI00022E0AA8|nr:MULTISPECIES: hypothetical protein [Mesorhizobium]OBP89881.1 hypothetical protein BAE40_13235 [Mesorhizobium loti]